MPFSIAFVILGPLAASALRRSGGDGDARAIRKPRCDLQSVPKFLLNLDRRPDRLFAFDTGLRQSAPWMLEGLCRVPAPDGLNLNESISPSLVQPAVWERARAEKGGSGVALAQAMGHALVWEQVRQTKAPWSIVFEDDVGNLHRNLANFLCGVLEGKEPALKDGWEYVQLQSNETFTRDDDSPVHAVGGTGVGTGMYLITREAAARMANLSFPLDDRRLDAQEGALRTGLKGFMAQPKAAEQLELFRNEADMGISLDRIDSFRVRIRDCRALRKFKMVRPELLDVFPA